MITAVDTNVIVALWSADPKLNIAARKSLDGAVGKGGLVISAPVFSELLAVPSRTESFVESFITNTSIFVDWNLSQAMWRTAGRAYGKYAARRKAQRDPGPRRILADFLIGAHAEEHGYSMLTLDDHLYRSAFPNLVIVPITPL